jgi:hypothetical protein
VGRAVGVLAQRLLLERWSGSRAGPARGHARRAPGRGRRLPATFTFRHAVSFLYGGRAVGLVHAGHDFLYSARFGADGVFILFWPVVRRPWGEAARLYRYDALVVVR